MLLWSGESTGIRQMHLVDQPGTQILLDRGGAAAKPNVLGTRCLVRPLQRGFDAIEHSS